MTDRYLKQKRARRERKRREREERTNEKLGIAANDSSDVVAVEALADGVLTPEERHEADARGQSAREYVLAEWDVEPGNYDNEQALMAAMSDAQREGED